MPVCCLRDVDLRFERHKRIELRLRERARRLEVARCGIRRLRAHGGQWALPGGRVDAGETVEEAALRELHEELGVPASADDVLGTLDDYPTRSGYLIAPVVVWSPGVTVTPNPDEVAAAYRIGCRELFRDGSPEIVPIEESDRPIIRLPLPVATVNAPIAAAAIQTVPAGQDRQYGTEEPDHHGADGSPAHGDPGWLSDEGISGLL